MFETEMSLIIIKLNKLFSDAIVGEDALDKLKCLDIDGEPEFT